MPEILKRKPCDPPKTTPPAKQCKIGVPKDAPRTSAQLSKTSSRQNLTLSDWMTVYSYVDSHPNVAQADIVCHFNTLATGALIFNQSTLSRKLCNCSKMVRSLMSMTVMRVTKMTMRMSQHCHVASLLSCARSSKLVACSMEVILNFHSIYHAILLNLELFCNERTSLL
jgi:hypothetical protein